MHTHTIGWLFAVVLAGCVTSDPVNGDHKSLTEEECKAQRGSIVYDIGDGATHRSDYVCSNGKSPLGGIAFPEGGPIPDEGAVCCPR